MKNFTYSKACEDLHEVMDFVVTERVPVRINRRGAKPVVLVDMGEWNSIQETLYLMSTPNNARRLLDSIANLEAGRNVVMVDPETMRPIE